MEDASPLRILLVEDNPGDARLIREMLRDAQAVAWRLDHVDRLADGLRRLAEEHADVVLLDLSLPDAHGFDTVGKVLDLAPTVPIIVLTGLDDEALAVRAVQAGAQDYLVKNDVTGGLLSRAIRYAIERKRAEAERAQLLDRERAARAQAENERARFRTILDAAPGGVIYIEAATGRLTANAEASRIFDRRLSPVEGIQQYAGALFRPDGQPMPINELPSRRALRGEVVHGEEMLIVQNDGSRLPVVSAASPVRDAAGQITGAVATYHDVSPLKELARLREEWTSVVAHDLRQPISIIMTISSALRDRLQAEAADSVDARAMEHISSAAERLNKMITDLLDFSLLEAHSLQLDLQPVDLGRLLQDVVERAAEISEDHRIELAMPAPRPSVVADPSRIEQVLGNLLSNAAKYSPAGTVIRVGLEQAEGQAHLTVSNEGVGIAAEELPHLFTRFHRTRAVRERKIAGLGLGLYLTRGLVEAHGGQIWAESEPGRTTTFHVVLPASALACDPVAAHARTR